MDEGHLTPYLQEMRKLLKKAGFSVAKENIVVTGGRVRAGYQVGETIFTNCGDAGMVVHIIGERPGSGHHAFSAYIANGGQNVWCKAGAMDHDSVKVVSGISDTGLNPKDAARETVALMKKM
jgi:ethanolamine ammonia-lyase large subunit